MAVMILMEREEREGENDACCAKKPEPGAPHAMGNCGPVRSCLVWFHKSADAICAVCDACAPCGALLGEEEEGEGGKKRKTTIRHECVCVQTNESKGRYVCGKMSGGGGEILALLCLFGLTPRLSPAARGRRAQMGCSPPVGFSRSLIICLLLPGSIHAAFSALQFSRIQA